MTTEERAWQIKIQDENRRRVRELDREASEFVAIVIGVSSFAALLYCVFYPLFS